MKTNTFRFSILLIMLTTLALFSSLTLASDDDLGIYFVPNVADQFNKLALRPDGLAFGIGNSPDPTQCKHYQGLARHYGTGLPYLFVSRSGNQPGFPCPPADDDPGNLLIVQMLSRNWTGERWRSNRLVRDWSVDDPIWPTPPDLRDRTVAYITFDGAGDWPAYGHPGGMQLIGDVLAVPLETPYGADPDNLILFIDVSSPESPEYLSKFNPGTGSEFSAGLVGLAPMLTDSGECCSYLMLVTGKANKVLRIFRSIPTDLSIGTTNLKDLSLTWQYLRSYTESQIEACISEDWHTGGGDAHQMLNFVREGGLTGPLYLIGGRNDTPLPSGDDYIDLYRVNFNPDGSPADCFLTYINKKHLTSYPIMGGGDSANFAAASGVHITPSGELIVYSAEYENDGPGDLLTGDRSVRFGEWRHRAVVQADSPTLRPTTIVDQDVYTVGEGGDVSLYADGEGPLTRAWITLFEDDDLGSSLPGFGDSDEWLHIDFDDWSKDDFDDLRKLDFSDQAGSWRWFAPHGCTLRVNDDDFGDDDFPGSYTRTLYGAGWVIEEPDLDQVVNDDGDCCMDDELTSMQFFPDCGDYYSANIGVSWDLDASGSFETHGKTVEFSASDLDGPSLASIFARAEHPSDPTALGNGNPVVVAVIVENVPPSVDSLAIFDSLYLEIGVDIPMLLIGLEATVKGTFTDPGKPDTQTANLDWGDGTVEASSVFDIFYNAFGGIIGEFEHTHVYQDSGTMNVEIAVTDDDGGVGESSVEIQVADPIEALNSVVDEIDALIATATNTDFIEALVRAREQLAGNNEGEPYNGALDKLEAEDYEAALIKIEAALEALVLAETYGLCDLSALKNLLGLAAESVARQAYLEVLVHIASPSKGELKQLDGIEQSITEGHDALAAGEHIVAVNLFHRATRKAFDLLR